MAGTAVNFAVALRATAECLGMFAAKVGLFAGNGIDFRLQGFETAAEKGMAGLKDGTWDWLEIGVTPLVPRVADGQDPVVLLATTAINSNFLMGHRDVTEIAALKGAKIGCLSVTGQTAFAANTVLSKYGIDGTVELVPLGTYPRIFAAVAAGEVQGAILAADYRFHGAVHHGMNALADIGAATGLPGTALISTRHVIAADPDLALRIVRTYVQAIHRFKTDRRAAIPFLHEHLNIDDADVVAGIYEYFVDTFEPLPYPSMDSIQCAIDETAKSNPGAAKVTPAQLVDVSFLDALKKEGLADRLYA
jgi:ABC-type nitrate/sulfonate/bicarbonate transport system substrate-binding protein